MAANLSRLNNSRLKFLIQSRIIQISTSYFFRKDAMKYIICILFLIPMQLFANSVSNTVAEVVKIRGEVTQLSVGSRFARSVSLGDKFVEDTSIVTGKKSFVKIKLIDNSEINLGPESKIVIAEMKKDSIGIITLLKGKIRTEVEKNAEALKTNKFFIKTRTAAMGVRGTDFQTIYNPENKMTSLLTYKGEVAMAKVDETTFKKLEEPAHPVTERNSISKAPEIQKVNAGPLNEVLELNKILKNKDTVVVLPGQNSFSTDSLKKTSLPVKISPVQLELLYKNSEFQEKTAANINLQSATNAHFKPTLKVANQVAPAEGLYNEKTGDFAPRSGGYIDLNTGLYIAPSSDSTLDSKTGVFTSNKIGDIDAETGQYVAPKGLILDAKKGFIIAGSETESEESKKPELLALRQDMNQSIARDIVGLGEEKEKVVQFNIKEKFIRDHLTFGLWTMSQKMEANKNSTTAPSLDLQSTNGAVRFQFEWQMATNNRFSPLVGIDYSIINFKNTQDKGVSPTSEKLLTLSYGVQYAFNPYMNFYTKFGLHQEHYLDQTASGSSNTYTLKKVVVSRLTAGALLEFWRNNKWSMDGSLAGLLTFKKSINNLTINQGSGLILEVLPKYKIADKKWWALGLKFEHQLQQIDGSVAINKVSRNTSGIELKYIIDL